MPELPEVEAIARTLRPLVRQRILCAQLKLSTRPVKEFLLDQGRVAGIENIYSGEALWHARLDPRRLANSLNGKEAANLHKAIVSVLRRALECCLDRPPMFSDPEWWFQGFEKILRTYQREGLSCKRCGRPIKCIEQAGRSTFFVRTARSELNRDAQFMRASLMVEKS